MICDKCGSEKEDIDGSLRCRPCRNNNVKIWRLNHPGYLKQWRARNPQYYANYRKKNRKKLNEYQRQLRAKLKAGNNG